MINNVDAQRFFMLFKGKSNTYVKNQLPDEAPKAGEKTKTKIISVEGTVDSDLLEQHLNGDFGVGICPVNAEGKCYFGVLDIDCYKPRIKRVLEIIKEHQLPLLPFKSKSGGLHVYFFVSKSVSAKSMREMLSKIEYYFALDALYGQGKVEIFPKQDKAEGFGSSVTLPYFKGDETYTPLLDLNGNPMAFSDALYYIQHHLSSLDEMKQALERLPFSDAPPCIQRILLSESVGGEDTGRNNFLFSYAVYAKKKYGASFDEYVRAINESFEAPIPDSDLEQTINSVRDNEYIYKCKDIPCNGFCDKATCRKREYGLGRDKGHFTGIDYGQLYRYMASEPYYVWKLRLQGQEEWKDVVFKSEADLWEQKKFACMCIRYLNQAPMQVSTNDWLSILNTVLPNVQEVTVKTESDTSETALVKNAFVSYLANKMAHSDKPYLINVGLCVRKKVDGKPKYYFTSQGFISYLRNQKINFDLTMLRETLKSFGAVEDTLVYVNALGEERRSPCWSKAEDVSISDAYANAMEVEENDRAVSGIKSVSEASNRDDEPAEKEKPYTQEDYDNAKNTF